MNKFIGIGRLTADPKVTDKTSKVARYTLAIDRYVKDGDNAADFISCIAFGKTAEFTENYLRKGTKILVEGHIQTGSYTKDSGEKVYTTDIIVDRHEFVESKNGGRIADAAPESKDINPIEIPEGLEDALPFK